MRRHRLRRAEDRPSREILIYVRHLNFDYFGSKSFQDFHTVQNRLGQFGINTIADMVFVQANPDALNTRFYVSKHIRHRVR